MSAAAQASELEVTYRRALRWYPKRWRDEQADAVIGTLLDQADDGHRTKPAKGELSNLRVNAVASRLDFVGRAVPVAVRTRTGIWMLGLGFAISVIGLFFAGWTWAEVDGTYRQVWTLPEFWHNIVGGQGVYLVWLAAGIAAVTGRRRAALWLVVASIPVGFAWQVAAWALSAHGHPGVVTIVFLDLLAILAIAGLASPQPRLRRRASVWSTIGVALVFGTYLLRNLTAGYLGNGAINVDTFWSPFAVWMIFLGLPLAVLAACVLGLRGRTGLAGSILMSAAPVLPLVVVAWGWSNETTVMAGIVAAVIIILGISAALILRGFGFRITITRAS